ncbi:YrzI family small protein [Peribacillus deserti]|uniref:YrzI family protein n=1 Tax=Peribacillus deserti TaxID=673318 RepID=A0A2N5M9A7_9BACI|nr:YrzI family small protein [Peribacillus deserti]PLT30915.1 YrzI family protein [Peribacillus deserti]
MTINMLFFTIIIKHVKTSREEAFHQEQIRQWHDQNRDRIAKLQNIM